MKYIFSYNLIDNDNLQPSEVYECLFIEKIEIAIDKKNLSDSKEDMKEIVSTRIHFQLIGYISEEIILIKDLKDNKEKRIFRNQIHFAKIKSKDFFKDRRKKVNFFLANDLHQQSL